MMEIVHVIPSISVGSGGPATAVINYASLLSSNYSCVICTTNEGLTDKVRQHYLNKGLTIVSFPFIGKHSFKFSPAQLYWILSHRRAIKLLHIHAGFSFMSELIGFVCILLKKPFIYRPLGTLSPYSLRVGNTWLKKLLLSVEKLLLKKAAVVHCTSYQEKTDCEILIGDSIQTRIIPPVVGNITVSKDIISKDNDKFTLGFLSRIDVKKNIEFIFNCMQRLPKKVHIQLAGNGEEKYLNYLKEKAVELGISDRITWKGFVADEHKSNFFSSIDCFVLPSFHENFGIVIIEALQAGVPCFVSPHVDAAQFGKSDAIIVLPLEVEQWVTALLDFFEQLQLSERKEKLSHEAIKYVNTHFVKEKIQKDLLDMYEDVLQGEIK